MWVGNLTILSVLGAFAIVALSVFLLGSAVRRVCTGYVRGYMESKTPIGWFSAGFINAMVSLDCNSVGSTVLGYGHSKMMPQVGVVYSLLGVAVAPIVFVLIVFSILDSLGVSLAYEYVAFTTVGMGYFVMLFSQRMKNIGRIVMAFGVLIFGLVFAYRGLFFGLETLAKGGFINVEYIYHITSYGVWSVLLGCGVGIVLSVIFRSSFLGAAFTIILLFQNFVGSELIIGMLIGSIIGVVFIEALMASRGGTTVKRAFVHHAMGLFIGFTFFVICYPIMSQIMISDHVLIALVFFLFLFLPVGTYFSLLMSKLVTLLLPNSQSGNIHLVMLSSTYRPDATLSLKQAHKEIVNHTRRTYKMVSFLRDMITEGCVDDKRADTLFERIEKYKLITDRVEKEILDYICSVALGDISRNNSVQMQNSITAMGGVTQIADEILEASVVVKSRMNVENGWSDVQLEMLIEVVNMLQQLQYAVIATLDEGKVTEYEKIYELIEAFVDSNIGKYYLYNQVATIEALSHMKKIAKLLCNLVKKQ